MNSGAGLLLVMGGLLLLYAVITGKFGVIESAFYQLFEIQQPAAPAPTPTGTGSANTQAADKAANDVLSSPNIGSTITLPKLFIPDYTQPQN